MNKKKDTEALNDYFLQSLTKTQSRITKLFDTLDIVDRKLYGWRMRLFVGGSIMVLFVAPYLDKYFNIPYDRITYYLTLLFFFYVLILVLCFVGAWRNEQGIWTWKRTKSRLHTYYGILKDELQATQTVSRDENLFKYSNLLLFLGLTWKVFANLSLFIRKPIENLFDGRFEKLRNFEKFTNDGWYLIPLTLGLFIMVYLFYQNKEIRKRIESELRQLFGYKKYATKYKTEIVNLEQNKSSELVILSKKEDHVTTTISSSNSILFSDFIKAIQNWNPRFADDEKIYQDRLFRYLRKHLPDANIETEYPITKRSGRSGRLDIVINDTIIIEMKRDSSAGATQRARGQLLEYSEVWIDKGPIILLLCDIEYEKARQLYQPAMNDLIDLNRSALTIVVRNKVENISIT
jgi:hypothetical protein